MPSPNATHPITTQDGEVWEHTVFLKNLIDSPNITIGDFSYYNDFRHDIKNYQRLLFPYIHPFSTEKVTIGKFAQIAHGAQFITSSANHDMEGFSTYPFAVFGAEWKDSYTAKWPNKGDTRISNDVWIGHEAVIMPAVTIGNGAIIGSRSVVTKDVPPYAIVGGNPAKVIRMRYDEATIKALEAIAWWDWPQESIEANLEAITGNEIELLKRINEAISQK